MHKKTQSQISVSMSEGGFTLLEGMLAAVFLGMGLLALTGMQSISLTRNVDANELTQVTAVASEMVERIQFNRKNVTFYNNMNTTSGGTGNCTTIIVPTVQPMASGDCVQWRSALMATNLSGIAGTIAVQAMGPTTPPLNQSRVTVTVTWLGSRKTDVTVQRNKTVTLQTIVAPE
jgi:type IV pilus assembly protein PilV